jgi:hypothetical protein
VVLDGWLVSVIVVAVLEQEHDEFYSFPHWLLGEFVSGRLCIISRVSALFILLVLLLWPCHTSLTCLVTRLCLAFLLLARTVSFFGET